MSENKFVAVERTKNTDSRNIVKIKNERKRVYKVKKNTDSRNII